MRIITLHQPYASLIALGFKQFETRSWSTPYRGKIAIHAGKREMKLHEFRVACRLLPAKTIAPIWEHATNNLGKIVAVADLTDCRMMNLAEEGEEDDPKFEWIECQSDIELSLGFWELGRYAWKLKDVEAIKPLPWRGTQGLCSLPLQTALFLESQVRRAKVGIG